MEGTTNRRGEEQEKEQRRAEEQEKETPSDDDSNAENANDMYMQDIQEMQNDYSIPSSEQLIDRDYDVWKCCWKRNTREGREG